MSPSTTYLWNSTNPTPPKTQHPPTTYHCNHVTKKTIRMKPLRLLPRLRVCTPTLGTYIPRRGLSRDANYITTPIFYVNAKPHLGHFYSMTLADVQNRWTKFQNRETFFTTGTDEHGLKVQAAAAKAGEDPKAFCDGLSRKFKDLAKLGEIDYDRFIRTTDPDHLEAVKQFWYTVWDKGYIYKGKHSGWYSVSDEAFYTDPDVEEITENGKTKMVSKETGSEVNYEGEENYFFKMSLFQDRLIEFYEANRQFVQPSVYYDSILNELKRGPLPDLSVSRPSWRLQWGIPVPTDDTQRVYVWFDALINYLTSLGYPKTAGYQLTPATHLIGKDITRFHCIHWPIFLMAAGLPLPRRVVVHGHWLMGGRKMSKSRGNVADPIEVADIYDADALRLFLMRYSVLDGDCDYSEEELNNTRNEFIDKFCNMVTRGLSKNFEIDTALQEIEAKSFAQLLNDVDDPQMRKDLTALADTVNGLAESIDADVSDMQMHRPMETIWETTRQVNALFEKYKPWSLKVTPGKTDEENAMATLKKHLLVFSALDTMRVLFILLQPFTPKYSELLLDRLHVSPEKRDVLHTKFGSDLTFAHNAYHRKKDKVPLTKVKLDD